MPTSPVVSPLLLDLLGMLTPLVVWAAAALVVGIRIVAVVLHLNAPQPVRPDGPR